MKFSRRLYQTIFAISAVTATTLPGCVTPAFAADAGEDPGPAGLNDVIVELERGEDRSVHAGYILDQLDVPEAKREDRIVPYVPEPGADPGFAFAINGLWLRLTSQEERDLIELDIDAVTSIYRATSFSLPVEPFDFADMTGRGYDYTPQYEDAGYRRVAGVPGDYSGATIGVIDTGVDMLHDDLNVVGGFDCTYSAPGRHGEDGAWGLDEHFHGTNVSGLAAAINNDRGTVGSGAGAAIRSYKVFDSSGSASTATVLCGVDQAARDAEAGRLDVANMSLGGSHEPSRCGGNDPYHNGVCYLANLIPVLVAAGNDGIDAVFKAPASFPEVITISALTDFDGEPGRLSHPSGSCGFAGEDDALAPFSNYGSAVDFIAPGVCTYATLPGNQYGEMSGTSMATPYATGVFAAYISECGAEGAREAITAWSYRSTWYEALGRWDGDVGPDHEPLISAGAPCGFAADDQSVQS